MVFILALFWSVFAAIKHFERVAV